MKETGDLEVPFVLTSQHQSYVVAVLLATGWEDVQWPSGMEEEDPLSSFEVEADNLTCSYTSASGHEIRLPATSILAIKIAPE